MKSRKVLLALDESEHSRAAVDAVFNKHCCRPATDEIHVLAVLPYIPDTPIIVPVGPASCGLLAPRIHHPASVQMKIEDVNAWKMLFEVEQLLVLDHCVPAKNIHKYVLPAIGGASGVSGTILAFAKSAGMDIIVVGSRGMGAVKSSLMSFVGLGSVGDALVKQALCPVLLFRKDVAAKSGQPENEVSPVTMYKPGAQAEEGKRVCLAYDDSPDAEFALSWTIANILQPQDDLDIVYVLNAKPFCPTLGESPEFFTGQEARDEAKEELMCTAQCILDKALAIAVSQGVQKENVGGSVENDDNVGQALVGYIHSHTIDVVVCGSRGMGGWKRALDSVIGLGSVSMHLARQVTGLVAVVHKPPPTACPAPLPDTTQSMK